jgi:glycine cleavage system H protein
MDHPHDRRYAPTHEWLLPFTEDTITVGISDYAQQALGDVVHADLPAIGSQVVAGQACCVLESVKAASDVHAPVTGEIIAINHKLSDTPELINDEPYNDGWLFRIKTTDIAGENLMSAQEYEVNIE